MFNSFNGQPYGAGYWQPAGNLQGNFGAAPFQQSYQPSDPTYQGQFIGQGQVGAYGGYQQQGWQQYPSYTNQQQQPQHAGFHAGVPAAGPAAGMPPLPDGGPPPLPPTPGEPPPPLPPDPPSDPEPPPLPPQGPAHPQSTFPAQPSYADNQQGPQGPLPPLPPEPSAPQAWAVPGTQPPYLHQPPYQHQQSTGITGAGVQAAAPGAQNGWYPNYQHQPPMLPGGYGAPVHPHYHYPHHTAAGYPMQPPGPTVAQYHPYGPTAPAMGTVPGAIPAAQTGLGPDSYAAHPPPAGEAAAPVSTPAPPAPVVIDITRLLRPPHRASRPAKLLLVLRGMPGSGKSTLARKIREAELEAGAEAPRLHSMDDYYMQEVEVEVVEEEGGRKKRRKVTELKYVHEPEMEATYFRDLVRSVGRSCEDRRHSFVVVDAPVMRAEQLRELTAAGQRANFECYVLRPLETDPEVCGSAGRNVHGHSVEELRRMAASFEEAPPLYTQVSAVSLFGGPVVGEEQGTAAGGTGRHKSRGGDIQEVEMEEGDEGDVEPDSADGDDDAADHAAPLQRRRPASRWDDVDDAGGGDGGENDAFRDSLRRKKKARAAVRSASVAAMAADDLARAHSAGDAGAAAAGPPSTIRRSASAPLKSALRRTPSRATPLSAGDGGDAAAAAPSSPSAASGGGNGGARRRVWWPDQGVDNDDGVSGSTAGQVRRSPLPPAMATPLAETVYLEGLGPPPELEDLPYGYQRKSSSSAAAGAAAAGPGSGHQHFREQAKAEHESEHDLFRRLLLGKQAGGGAGAAAWGGGGGSSGSAPGSTLGLFESAPEDDDA